MVCTLTGRPPGCALGADGGGPAIPGPTLRPSVVVYRGRYALRGVLAFVGLVFFSGCLDLARLPFCGWVLGGNKYDQQHVEYCWPTWCSGLALYVSTAGVLVARDRGG